MDFLRSEGADGFCDVWKVTEDGGGEECITGEACGIPTRNNGQLAWHPSGRYLVFQSEKAESTLTHVTTPGAGVLNDLWLMNADGSGKHQLTHANRAGHEHQNWREGRVGSTIFADSSWHADGDRFVVLTLLTRADGASVVTGGKRLDESVLLVRPVQRLLGGLNQEGTASNPTRTSRTIVVPSKRRVAREVVHWLRANQAGISRCR